MSDHVICPHCGTSNDMTEAENMHRHVTYHGEDSPVSKECDTCGREFFLHERVTRWWGVGKTAREAFVD